MSFQYTKFYTKSTVSESSMALRRFNPPYAVNRPRTNSPLSPPFCGYSSFEAQADNALVVCVTRASLSFARFVPSLVLKLLLRKTFSALFKVLVWW